MENLFFWFLFFSKPNVTPVEVFPVYPDFVNWKFPCAQVIFDSDPAPTNTNKHDVAQLEEMSQAMIRLVEFPRFTNNNAIYFSYINLLINHNNLNFRGVMDESGEQFVAYFLPTEETLEKRRSDLINEVLYVDDQEYEYKMAREYNWNVKSKASKGYEENYFLVMRPDGVYYNELETRVRLNKRRQNIGQQPNNTKYDLLVRINFDTWIQTFWFISFRLVVKHIPLNESEHRLQRYRERQLEPTCEEEEIEEIEMHEEPEQVTEIEKPTETQEDVEVEKETDEKAKADGNESDHSEKSRSSRSKSRSVSSECLIHHQKELSTVWIWTNGWI